MPGIHTATSKCLEQSSKVGSSYPKNVIGGVQTLRFAFGHFVRIKQRWSLKQGQLAFQTHSWLLYYTCSEVLKFGFVAHQKTTILDGLQDSLLCPVNAHQRLDNLLWRGGGREREHFCSITLIASGKVKCYLRCLSSKKFENHHTSYHVAVIKNIYVPLFNKKIAKHLRSKT